MMVPKNYYGGVAVGESGGDTRTVSRPCAHAPPGRGGLAEHERLLRNFTGIGIPKAERPERLTFELILTPDEAENRHPGLPVHSAPEDRRGQAKGNQDRGVVVR
jgi:hypothetical protein